MLVSFAQQKHKEDSIKTTFLNEISVEEAGQDVTGFYKSNQLSSIEDILQKNSNINLIRRGNYALEPSINGLSAGQINVTIDDMKVFGACTDKMDPTTSYTETNNLASMEIQEGAGGNEQGSNIGGSLNMKLQKARFQSGKIWSGNFKTAYNSVSNGTDMSGVLNYSQGKLAVRYAGTYRKHQSYKNGSGQEVKYSQFEKMNHALMGSYKLSESDLVTFSVITDDAWNVGYPALTMDVGFAKARIFGLGYEKFNIGEHFHHFRAKVYANTVAHAMDDSKRPDEEVAVRMDMPGWSDTYGGLMEGMWQFGKHEFTARIDAYQNNVRAEMTMYTQPVSFMLTWADTERKAVGSYIKGKHHFDKFIAEWNLRMDYAQTEMTSEFGKGQLETLGFSDVEPDQRVLVSPQVAIEVPLKGMYKSRFSVAYTSRLPSITELYGFFLYNRQDGYDYVGSPNIKSEKAYQWIWNNTFERPLWTLKTNLFYYHIQDYIMGETLEGTQRMTIGANGVKAFVNIDNAQLMGINGEFSYQISEHLNTVNTYQYTYGQDFESNPLPQIEPFKWLSAFRYTHKKWFVQAEYQFASAQKRISETFGEISSEAYHISNLRAGYHTKWNKNNLKVNFAVENLFDAYYRSHLDWGGIYRQGRNMSASAVFSF